MLGVRNVILLKLRIIQQFLLPVLEPSQGYHSLFLSIGLWSQIVRRVFHLVSLKLSCREVDVSFQQCHHRIYALLPNWLVTYLLLHQIHAQVGEQYFKLHLAYSP